MLNKRRGFLAAINVVIFVYGILLVSAPGNPGKDERCVVYEPVIGLGIAYMILSFIGVCVVVFERKMVEWIYLSVFKIFIIAGVSYSILLSVSTPKHSAEETRQQEINGYWLKQYNTILQKALIGGNKWHKLRNCFQRNRMCDEIRSASKNMTFNPSSDVYYLERCGIVKKNETSWGIPQIGLSSKVEECVKWMNVSGREYYDCDSCRAAYLAASQNLQKQTNRFTIMRYVALVLTCAYAYYALRDQKEQPINYWNASSQEL